MKRMHTHIFLALLLTLSGCSFLINTMAFHPDRTNVLSTEQLPDKIEEIFLETDDDLKLQSYFIANQYSEDILIYFHGNAGNLTNRIPDLLKLNSFGINVLCVTYRGYGKSEGSPSERGIYIDGKAAYQHVTKNMKYSSENIIIMGRSIGTAVAVNTAQNRNIKGLILVTPLTSGKEHARLSGLSIISSAAGDSFNNIEKIKNIKCPLLVIHGTHDRVIPLSMGKAIYENAVVEKEMFIIKGAGHNNLSNEYRTEYWPSIDRFINNQCD